MWASRWDHYLSHGSNKVHWVSLFNSLLIVIFLSGLVAMVIIRTLRRDIARYNDLSVQEDAVTEEYGWKLIHGDVFRAPRFHLILCALVGSGLQLAITSSIVLSMFAVRGVVYFEYCLIYTIVHDRLTTIFSDKLLYVYYFFLVYT